MRILRLLFYTQVVFLLPFNGKCQTILSLEDVIKLVRNNSLSSKYIRSNQKANMWKFALARNKLKPTISLVGSIPGFSRQIGQVIQPDGALLFRDYTRSASFANINFQQPILATGGTIGVLTNLSRIDVFGSNRSLLWASTPFSVFINQPLFRVNELKSNWDQQKLIYNQSIKSQVESLEDITILAVESFFKVHLAQSQLKNARYNKNVNDTLSKITKDRFELGRISKSDWLQAELGRLNANNTVDLYYAQLLTSLRELQNLTGIKDSLITSAVKLDIPLNLNIDADSAVIQAKQNRSEFVSYELLQKQFEYKILSLKSSQKFTADLNVSFGYNQSSSNIKTAYSNLQSAQSVSVEFTIPIFTSGQNNASIEATISEFEANKYKIEYNKNRLDLDILNQISSVNQLKSSANIVSIADTIAQERFESLRDRYKIGKTSIFDLSVAQQEKDSAFLSYIITLRDFWISYYTLRRLTLFDFFEGKILNSN